MIFAIIFISGLVKGTTGFGFALFSLPLLVHIIPIKNLIPLITLFNLSSSIQIIIQTRQLKLNRRILALSLTGVAGVIIGSLVLKFISDIWLKLFVSVMLIVTSILFLTGYRFNIRKIKRGIVIAGFISGFLGGGTSVSGPPLALFLTSLKLDTIHFRFTFAWFSIITASVAMMDYTKIGVVQPNILLIFAVSFPLLLASVMLGKWISHKISQEHFYKGAVLLTLIAGITLLVTCLGACLR
jgi:uncharacterized protein